MKKPFTVKLIGKWFSVDGGENDFKGAEGFEGSYETFEEALANGLKVLSEQSVLVISDWHSENTDRVVFSLDGSFKGAYKNAA